MEKYEPTVIEKKWQERWEKKKSYSPNLDKVKRPFYNLMMFPYPSAEGLHVGNMYAFTGSDIYGRFKRMQGFEVFEPIGLDGFGIHSENYALKVGRHPKEQAVVSEKNFYRQLRATGNAFDWSRKLETYDPAYYKWTQWIFIQMFKKGLAYRKKAPVNFCPSCKTVLADEQVINDQCERCQSVVEKRQLEQWFFKITAYADRLLNGLSQIDWTEKVKIAQRNWIGRSEGVQIEFKVQSSKFKVPVFTTRPDTLFGATFMVLSPKHPLIKQIITPQYQQKISKYIKGIVGKVNDVEDKEKTGVFTGNYAINPVNNKKIPIWVADYVSLEYGTGAIMAVPAHDQRDFEFAKNYKLPIIQVIKPTGREQSLKKEAYVGAGTIVNSGSWNGLRVPDQIGKVINWLEEKKLGEKQVHYHLRDWLISRQRYWGPPIPMINCKKQGWQPVPEKDLPVLLPEVKDWRPNTSTSLSVKGPLANHPEFYNVACPQCQGAARRETDVSDTFLDSAWYFFRYISTEFNDQPFDKARVKKWLPVDMYIGGAEHSVLHLLYTRFLTMAFKDLGLINFKEPFKKFYAHGLLISKGAKMSKSRGNVIIPDSYIKKYGADTLRTYLMFLGPFNQGGDFRDTGIEGMYRFLKRVWKLIISHLSLANRKTKDQSPKTKDQLRMMHRTVKKVTHDIENLRYNTAIASLMEYYNFLSKQRTVSRKEIEVFLKLLAPFAPHMTEELYQRLRAGISNFQSLHTQPWPVYDSKFLEEEAVTIVVQINGRVRDTFPLPASRFKLQERVEEKALKREKVKRYLKDKVVEKVIYVPGKIINFVVTG